MSLMSRCQVIKLAMCIPQPIECVHQSGTIVEGSRQLCGRSHLLQCVLDSTSVPICRPHLKHDVGFQPAIPGFDSYLIARAISSKRSLELALREVKIPYFATG